MIGGEVFWRDVSGRPSWRFAHVTAVSPVELTLEGDLDPLDADPTVLVHVGPLALGDKVWCQNFPGGACVVIGKV